MVKVGMQNGERQTRVKMYGWWAEEQKVWNVAQLCFLAFVGLSGMVCVTSQTASQQSFVLDMFRFLCYVHDHSIQFSNLTVIWLSSLNHGKVSPTPLQPLGWANRENCFHMFIGKVLKVFTMQKKQSSFFFHLHWYKSNWSWRARFSVTPPIHSCAAPWSSANPCRSCKQSQGYQMTIWLECCSHAPFYLHWRPGGRVVQSKAVLGCTKASWWSSYRTSQPLQTSHLKHEDLNISEV